jgi:hypothetical protein
MEQPRNALAFRFLALLRFFFRRIKQKLDTELEERHKWVRRTKIETYFMHFLTIDFLQLPREYSIRENVDMRAGMNDQAIQNPTNIVHQLRLSLSFIRVLTEYATGWTIQKNRHWIVTVVNVVADNLNVIDKKME